MKVISYAATSRSDDRVWSTVEVVVDVSVDRAGDVIAVLLCRKRAREKLRNWKGLPWNAGVGVDVRMLEAVNLFAVVIDRTRRLRWNGEIRAVRRFPEASLGNKMRDNCIVVGDIAEQWHFELKLPEMTFCPAEPHR